MMPLIAEDRMPRGWAILITTPLIAGMIWATPVFGVEFPCLPVRMIATKDKDGFYEYLLADGSHQRSKVKVKGVPRPEKHPLLNSATRRAKKLQPLLNVTCTTLQIVQAIFFISGGIHVQIPLTRPN